MPLSRRAALAGLLAGASAAPLAAAAQTSPRAPAGGVSATQEVLALREKIRAAAAAKDRAVLEALYADNFMHMRDSGRADLKAERIALLVAGEPAIETAPEDGLSVQVYGSATAVATGASPIRDAATGKPSLFRWVVVYFKGDAGWQVALSQASRVPARR
ncbi:MAG TPA: nuclear transport factor 2 family protein [Beijerinckiaceae bacterium]